MAQYNLNDFKKPFINIPAGKNDFYEQVENMFRLNAE